MRASDDRGTVWYKLGLLYFWPLIISTPGGPGHTIYASFSGALFLCGGSGISFGLAALQELVQKDLEVTSRVKAIELIWCIQDPGLFTFVYILLY